MNQLVMDRTARARAAARRTDASTAPRTATTRAAVDVAPVAGHEWRGLALVALGVVLVMALATWSFAQGWGRGPVVGPGELALDGGIVRVDGVVSAARPQHAMPGMGADEDPVADGHRRVSVDVTLVAGTSAMEYEAERFGLTVDGRDADRLTHRDVLPGDVLPAGTRLSGTILFDVPLDATTATLTYDGRGATDIVLPPEEEQTTPASSDDDPMTGAGHGAGDHGATTGAGAGQ